MKRCLYLVAALVIMLSFIGISCAEKPAAPAEVITLRVADNYPIGHPISVGFTFFMSDVESETGGRIKFDYYPNNTLCKGPDILDTVIAGGAHMGNMIYAGGKAPWIFFTQLPGAYTDEETAIASQAMHKVSMAGFPEQEWEKLGVKALVGWTVSNYQIATTEKPVRTLADLKGVKVRAAGAALPKAIDALGGVAVSMPIGEAYEAISKGVLDGASLAIPSYKPYAFFELLKYFNIGFSLGGYPVYYVINLDTWNRLPSDIQDIMVKAGEKCVVDSAKYYYRVLQTDVDEWKRLGKEVSYLSPEEQATVKATIAPVKETWISETEAKGYPVRKLVADWEAAMEELR